MQLSTYQKEVDNWILEVGKGYFDPLTNTAILMEEVGEVACLMARMYGGQSFKEKVSAKQAKKKLADEMCDVLFVLTCLANQCGVNLEKSIQANFKKKTARDAKRHAQNTKKRVG